MASTRRTLCALVALLLAGCKTQGEWGKYEHRQYLPSVGQLRDDSDDEFYFAFPAGVERRRFALLALESLNIGNGVTIRPTDPSFYTSISSVLPPGYGAFVGSLGQMRIGDGAAVGSIYAWGDDVEMGHRVSAAGSIRHANAPLRSGVHAALGALTVDASAVAVYTFAPSLDPVTNSAPSRRTGKAGSLPLEVPPGVYNEIVAADGATLRFSSGSYRVRALHIGQGSVLEIANSAGPVDIWIEQDLDVHGMIEEQLLVPNILLLYAGPESLVLSQPFRGTLVAPRAEITLLATDPSHVGAFYARKIIVAPETAIRHVTFYREMQPPMSLDRVCETCVADARSDAAECEAGLPGQQQLLQLTAPGVAYDECQNAVQTKLQRCLLHKHWRPESCPSVRVAF